MILNIILAAVTGAAITAMVAVLLCRHKPKPKKKGQSNMEFSKKIFLGLSVLVTGISVFVCVMVWRTDDISVTNALIDQAFGLLKFGVVSYFTKAALENRIKLAHLFPKLKHKIFNEGGGGP